MCGIAGIYYFDTDQKQKFKNTSVVLEKLKHRGPDHQGSLEIDSAILFHTRLSIIDTSSASHQPFKKNKGVLCFNGEIFNYKKLQNEYSGLQTSGDVEVLHAMMEQKHDLNKINGYFAFSYYNAEDGSLFIARDRFGVKPLYYYQDQEKFAFSSELKALLELIGEKQELDHEQIYTYFRLNYCAGERSIFKNIKQVLPGHRILIKGRDITIDPWYIAKKNQNSVPFKELLNDAVALRLQADVPVGSFLSGGVDSSIISAIAKEHHPQLHTFSIGFKDETYFDESSYANLVAKHIGSIHHEFKISSTDFEENIQSFLESIDEPFADSSAFNVYILSKLTKEHVKVALSGDGADELFKGYNKHKALHLARSRSNRWFVHTLHPLGKLFKESRQGKLPNKFRQLSKFKKLIELDDLERLKFLAQISSGDEVHALLKKNVAPDYFNGLFKVNVNFQKFELKDVFDIQTVLKDDMLVKADRYSMQHGLELRNPFLDYRIMEYALNLHDSEKINDKKQKLILQKEFASLLPNEIFQRPKKGFELPLWKWLNTTLRDQIENTWLSRSFIEQQALFNYDHVQQLKNKLFSTDPGDTAAKVWALIIFQNWYMANLKYIKA